MATEDKAAHKATEIKGDVKENLGKATGDREMEAEGQADQAKGNLEQAATRSRTPSRSNGRTRMRHERNSAGAWR